MLSQSELRTGASGVWDGLATMPTGSTELDSFADAQASFPELPASAAAGDGMFCEFSELLDSFSQFLESTEDAGADFQDAFDDAPLSPTRAAATPHFQSQAFQQSVPPLTPGLRSSSFPTGYVTETTFIPSGSTSSSSQCIVSASTPPGLGSKSQSGGHTSSNSQSSSSTSSGGSSKEKVDVSKSDRGSTLLAKLKDLCKSNGTATPKPAGAGSPGAPAAEDVPSVANFPPVADSPLMCQWQTSAEPTKEASMDAPVLALPQAGPVLPGADLPTQQGFGHMASFNHLPVPRSEAFAVCAQRGQLLFSADQTNFSMEMGAMKSVNEDLCSSQENGSGGGLEGLDGDCGGTDVEGSADPEGRQRQQRLLRNRQSALQSRQRRKMYMGELEQKCRALEGQVGHMRQIVAMTAMENGALRDEIVRLQHLMAQPPTWHQELGGSPAPPVGGEHMPVKSGSRRSSRAASPSSPALSGKDAEEYVLPGGEVAGRVVEAVGVVKEPESQKNRDVSKEVPVAVTLGAEPAALSSDSLPMESLLPTQRQHTGALFVLILFVLSWAVSPLALVSHSLSPPLLGLYLGLYPECPSHHCAVQPQALLDPLWQLQGAQDSSKRRVANLSLWEEDDPGERGVILLEGQVEMGGSPVVGSV